MQRVTIGKTWIFDGNLLPFVRFVAQRANCELFPEELEAIRLGVRETNHERDLWYAYEFQGAVAVSLSFAIEPGSSVVFWRAECPFEMRDAIEAAADVMQEYRLN